MTRDIKQVWTDGGYAATFTDDPEQQRMLDDADAVKYQQKVGMQDYKPGQKATVAITSTRKKVSFKDAKAAVAKG